MLTITENALVYAFHGETVRVDASLPGSVRVRAWMEAEMPDGPHALLDLSPAPCRTWQTEQAAFLQTGDLTVRLTAEGVLGFYRHDTLLLEEAACVCLPMDPAYPSRTQRLPLRRPARQWQAHGSDWQLTVRFTAPEEERLFGMGQYQQPTWNLKGAALELMQRNSQCTVPFVLSSAGYGFLWNQPAVGQAVFATNETRWEAIATRRMDYWLSLGETPAAILRQYADATGHAPDMPEFALGFWQSKLRYRTQAEVLAVAEAYRSRGLPLSVLIIDFFHWTKLGEWRYDPAAARHGRPSGRIRLAPRGLGQRGSPRPVCPGIAAAHGCRLRPDGYLWRQQHLSGSDKPRGTGISAKAHPGKLRILRRGFLLAGRG